MSDTTIYDEVVGQMSDPTFSSYTPEPEPPVEEEVGKRRGRPRSQDALNRDEQVFNALSEGPKSKRELMAELGYTANLVYLSLYRLRDEGKVARSESWYLT